MKKRIIVTGAGGFIGGHLVNRLCSEGNEVVGVDIKPPHQWYQYNNKAINHTSDLKRKDACSDLINAYKPDEIYNLASDLGGMGFIGNNKIPCMMNVLINTYLLEACAKFHKPKVYFFASSSYVYDQDNELSQKEDMVYPANPEHSYGMEKLFSERMCEIFHEATGIPIYIARFAAVYGPYGTWRGGKEKAPAAMCRKVIEAMDSNYDIEIWGDGKQTRQYIYIDDLISLILKLTSTDYHKPINMASDEITTINDIVSILEKINGVSLRRKYIDGPIGKKICKVDTSFMKELLGYKTTITFEKGIENTYKNIKSYYDLDKSGTKVPD